MNWRFLLSDVDLGDDEAQAASNVVRSKWLSAGEVTAKFESEFQSMMGAQHAVATNSCTAALHLAMMALGIGPGDEVLVPSYTFVASANAILYQGATPVFVDICGPQDLNLDPDDVVRKTTSRTKAIVVVHFAGFMADMDSILEHAKQRQLFVVEDACHAIGSRYISPQNERTNGKRAGTIGDIGCFSFFANKNLVTGEGGMLITDDASLASAVKSLRSHGMTKSSWDKANGRATDYDVAQLGYNYRPTEITSAIGRIQLTKLDRNNSRRATIAECYREILKEYPGVVVPFGSRHEMASHHIFPILVAPQVRDSIREQLREQGIQTSIHYSPVHQFTHYRKLSPSPLKLPVTEGIAASEITLPLHPFMTTDDVHVICHELQTALKRVGSDIGV